MEIKETSLFHVKIFMLGWLFCKICCFRLVWPDSYPFALCYHLHAVEDRLLETRRLEQWRRRRRRRQRERRKQLILREKRSPRHHAISNCHFTVRYSDDHSRKIRLHLKNWAVTNYLIEFEKMQIDRSGDFFAAAMASSWLHKLLS